MNGVTVPKDFNKIVEYYIQHYENIIDRLFAENGYERVKAEPAVTE
jgi:spore maturation protein CgeB